MLHKITKIFALPCLPLLVLFSSACSTTMHSSPGTTTTVILIRHAERTTMGGALTELGTENARALVEKIGAKNITAIYSPDLVRNLDTVRPLATHLNIQVTKVSQDPNVHDVAIDILSEHTGETVLWVGNTSNLPELYYLLGGSGEPPVGYGEIYTVMVPDKGRSTIIKDQWGRRKTE